MWFHIARSGSLQGDRRKFSLLSCGDAGMPEPVILSCQFWALKKSPFAWCVGNGYSTPLKNKMGIFPCELARRSSFCNFISVIYSVVIKLIGGARIPEVCQRMLCSQFQCRINWWEEKPHSKLVLGGVWGWGDEVGEQHWDIACPGAAWTWGSNGPGGPVLVGLSQRPSKWETMHFLLTDGSKWSCGVWNESTEIIQKYMSIIFGLYN